MLSFDHIAVACENLDEGVRYVENTLGAQMSGGGQHPQYGTHNRLMRLEDGLYLEVIAKDPSASAQQRPRWFDLDAFSGAPRLVNWICRTNDLEAAVEAAPQSIGRPQAVSRGNAHWRITVPADGTLPFEGAYPTLMQWGHGVSHPVETLPENGCRLLSWTVSHPKAMHLKGIVDLTDPRVRFVEGSPCFAAEILTPDRKVLFK